MNDRPAPRPRTISDIVREMRERAEAARPPPVPPPNAPPPPKPHHEREDDR